MNRVLLTLVSAVFIIAVSNGVFFEKLFALYSPWLENIPFVISVVVMQVALLALLMTLLAIFVGTKAAITISLVLAAVASYFADQFGTIIDDQMLINMFQTDIAEAGDLLGPKLLLGLAIFAGGPAYLIWKAPLGKPSLAKHLIENATLVFASATVLVLCILPMGEYYASFFREHKEVRHYAIPAYPMYSVGKLAFDVITDGDNKEFVTLVDDPQISPGDSSHELIIMVVGETARFDRFGINGYPRDTSPNLDKMDGLVSYTNVSSCGTSTAISVPCMFSVENRDEFVRSEFSYTQNVVDVMSDAGVKVLWRDNNSSSKGVATRVAYEDFRSPELNPDCDDECRDVGMLAGLQEYVDLQKEDTFVVLHQMGNHGPAYSKRYPKEHEYFSPACESKQLSDCSQEEIDNAYDNAIRYTDYFLNEVVEFLKRNTPKYETAMIYVSDHGESLGEKGIYLHGLPYMIAPDEQTHVPVFVWVGGTSDIDVTSVMANKDKAFSHDEVSSTLLTTFEIDHEGLENKAVLFSLKPE